MNAKHIVLSGLTLLFASCMPGEGDDRPRIGPRVRTSATLRQFGSCAALERKLRENYAEELRATLLANAERYRSPVNYASPEEAGASTGSREEGVNYSGTNNQEAGVDEEDFVKTDGHFIYVLSGRRLEIAAVPTIGALEKAGGAVIEGWPTQMLLLGNRVAVVSNIYAWDLPAEHPLAAWLGRDEVPGYGAWYRIPVVTKLTVLDVSDRAAPAVVREVYLDGWHQTGRRVGGTVRLLSYAYVEVPGVQAWLAMPERYWRADPKEGSKIVDEVAAAAIKANEAVIARAPLDELVPRVLVRERGGELVPYSFTAEGCTNFAIPDDGMSRGFTSILTLDLSGEDFTMEADHLVSSPSTIYASADTLIVAEPAQEAWWFWDTENFEEATNLHAFDIGAAGTTTYRASGRVPGVVKDQFSLSEKDGFIRVAATTGQSWWRWWVEAPAEPESHVFVLGSAESVEVMGHVAGTAVTRVTPAPRGGGGLAIIGHVGGIAVGEQLWSSRFVGDRAYLVTFRRIDPLWTIDVSDPANPRVAGELQVPGVSTYLHPLAGDRLLTIGYGGDDSGLDWSLQLSLFDATDMAHAVLVDTLAFAPPPPAQGWSWAWSEATYEHRAFQYWPPLGLLAVPLSTYRHVRGCLGPDDPYCWRYEYRSSLELVRVDPGAGTLARYGSIDHSAYFNSDPHSWWGSRDVRRSIFMHDDALGDFLYAVSDRAISVHRVTDGLPLGGAVMLEGTPHHRSY